MRLVNEEYDYQYQQTIKDLNEAYKLYTENVKQLKTLMTAIRQSNYKQILDEFEFTNGFMDEISKAAGKLNKCAYDIQYVTGWLQTALDLMTAMEEHPENYK